MRSRRTWLKRISSLAAVVVLLAAFQCSPQKTAVPAKQPGTPAPKIVLADGFPVIVEVAADDDMRAQGLMFRDHLDENRGMIFLFAQPGDYAFWMKNTIIPLDMIWIDDAHRVVHVEHDVPPCKADPCPSYPPGVQARSVLELAAGVAARHHIANGDQLRFEGLDHILPR